MDMGSGYVFLEADAGLARRSLYGLTAGAVDRKAIWAVREDGRKVPPVTVHVRWLEEAPAALLVTGRATWGDGDYALEATVPRVGGPAQLRLKPLSARRSGAGSFEGGRVGDAGATTED